MTADTANLTIYVTEGGVFDAARSGLPQPTRPVTARMTIEFADCSEGTGQL